jgi:hypothetical protein
MTGAKLGCASAKSRNRQGPSSDRCELPVDNAPRISDVPATADRSQEPPFGRGSCAPPNPIGRARPLRLLSGPIASFRRLRIRCHRR